MEVKACLLQQQVGLKDELVGEASWPQICVVRRCRESDSARSIGSRLGRTAWLSHRIGCGTGRA